MVFKFFFRISLFVLFRFERVQSKEILFVESLKYHRKADVIISMK